MKNWKKRIIAVISCVVMVITSLHISAPQNVNAATTGDVYDFNGTDFSTELLDGEGSGPLTSANRAILLADTSAVPEGFADGVYGGGKTKAYASVPVDFAKPIDLSKVTSIKVRMYVNGTDISSDKLRILSGDNTTAGTYEELAFATYGASQTWCEIDITDILNNTKLANAKDENGYLDRFIIAHRIYGNSTILYFDSIIIEGENYFVESGDIYDFNGTDFSTALLDGEGSGSNPLSSAYLVTSIGDTSGVPEGFTDGVYGGGGSNYASVPVDFANPIDLSKVDSIKIRMYVTEYTLSGTPKLRILSQDNTATGTYTETTYTDAGITFGKWCEVDITDELNSSNIAKDENGYLDRFILAYRVYGSTTPTVYFDHIAIVGEDYFVSQETEEPDEPSIPETPTEFTAVTISDFVDSSGNQMAEKSYGYTDSPQTDLFHLKDYTDFDNKMLSMKIKYEYGDYHTRLDVAGSNTYNGLRVYPNTTGTYLFIVAAKESTGTETYQACEIEANAAGMTSFLDKEFILQLGFEFGEIGSNNKADVQLSVYLNGNLYKNQKFTITGCDMSYFGNCMDLYREHVDSVITVSSATADSLDDANTYTIEHFVDTDGQQMEAKDYPHIDGNIDDFYLNGYTSFDGKSLHLRLKYQYGDADTRIHVAGSSTYSGLMIYPNKTGTHLFVVASQDYAGTDTYQAMEISAATAGVTSFINKDFLLKLKFDFGEANSSNKADLTLGVYVNGKLYNGQTHTFTNCNLSKFGNRMTLYRSNTSSVITVGPAKLEPVVYDFNGTDFDTTVYSSEGNGVLASANLATKITETSTVPTGFSGGVYGGCHNPYVSVPVCFPQAIDLTKVMSVKLRMFVPEELTSLRIRIFTNDSISDASYADASYKDNLEGVCGEWHEVDITGLLKDSNVAKDSNGNLGRFIIGLRTYDTAGTSTCYFDSIIIDGFDYFVSEEGTFRDVTIAKHGDESAFNTETNMWNIYPIPEKPTGVPGQEGITTFEVDCDIDGIAYKSTFVRSDNTKGLSMTIPAGQLPAAADGVIVTIKAGEYAPNGVTAGIRITQDYAIYLHKGELMEYEGEFLCEADNGVYVVEEGENIMIDGESVAAGDEYSNPGVHLMTYSEEGYEYVKHLIIYHYGDMDDDGEIKANDLVAMKKHIINQREVTKAGAKAADMDIDYNVTEKDVKLLRKRFVTDSGTLVLCPTEGRIVADADDVAEEYVTDYYVTKADTFGTEPIVCKREVIVLKWISFENVASYTVKLAMKNDMSDAITYETTECKLELLNLCVDTDYYWTVTAGDYASDIQTFHTQDTIRSLTIEGVANARDGGGWHTTDGKYVKQGMFYRGAKIDDITQAGKDVMLHQLGIKTDLDLRNPGEEAAGSSPLGTGVNYINVGGPYYWDDTRGINAAAYQDALVTEIKTFANPDNYPIYVHCSIGRDRTGTICFLINALLGVEEQDLYMDYEFSTLSLARTEYSSAKWMTGVFKTMYDNVQAYAPNGTMAEATEAFMLSIGVTQDEINAIREILLEEQ